MTEIPVYLANDESIGYFISDLESSDGIRKLEESERNKVVLHIPSIDDPSIGYIDAKDLIPNIDDLIKSLLEISEDYGTFVQQLVMMCVEDTEDSKELMTLIEDRFTSLQEQCDEFLGRLEW